MIRSDSFFSKFQISKTLKLPTSLDLNFRSTDFSSISISKPSIGATKIKSGTPVNVHWMARERSIYHLDTPFCQDPLLSWPQQVKVVASGVEKPSSTEHGGEYRNASPQVLRAGVLRINTQLLACLALQMTWQHRSLLCGCQRPAAEHTCRWRMAFHKSSACSRWSIEGPMGMEV